MLLLDEPTIGLHQRRDNDRLIGTLRKLSDIGNTVLVVEHDEGMIYARLTMSSTSGWKRGQGRRNDRRSRRRR